VLPSVCGPSNYAATIQGRTNSFASTNDLFIPSIGDDFARDLFLMCGKLAWPSHDVKDQTANDFKTR
jgi:hypothetical protein